MQAIHRAAQLTFDFAPATPSEAAYILAERLIARVIVTNACLLGINRNLRNPGPAPAPLRLYNFPLEFVSRNSLEDGMGSALRIRRGS